VRHWYSWHSFDLDIIHCQSMSLWIPNLVQCHAYDSRPHSSANQGLQKDNRHGARCSQTSRSKGISGSAEDRVLRLARSSAHLDDVYHDSHDSAVAGVHERCGLPVPAGSAGCRRPAEVVRSRDLCTGKGICRDAPRRPADLEDARPIFHSLPFHLYSAHYQKLPSNASVRLVLIPNRECAISSRQGGRQSFDCVFR
jgi:hypothetical protein